MASGYGNWEMDNCDVGLGLKIPWQEQQTQQQNLSFSWLHNRQNYTENSNNRSSSPTISGFSQASRFGNFSYPNHFLVSFLCNEIGIISWEFLFV